MISRGLATFGVAVLFAAALPQPATAQSDQPRLYQLQTNSAFLTGCFGPCACPVITQSPLKGTYVLRRISVDPLFTTYEVSDVQWTIQDQSTTTPVHGSGTYRIGGEVAIQEQMVLDLTIGANAPLRFDSGLIAGGGEFPDINIGISLHQEQACRDSVFDIQSKPAVATGVDGGPKPRAVSILNPFRTATEVRLTLDHTQRVTIDIFDAQGRLVRRLTQGRIVPAGGAVVSWDGLSERGAACAAGVYLFRVTSEEGVVLKRATKLK